MRELAIGNDIGRVRKGGHPSPVFESRVPADVIGVQMRAHDIIDIVHGESGSRQAFFETIAVQHVPKRARRSRLMVADAGVDQNVVAERLDNEALNTEHQPVLDIDKFRLQPSSVLVEQFFREVRKETQRVKKRSLLLDHRMDGDRAKRQRRYHREAPTFILLKLYGGLGDGEQAVAQLQCGVRCAQTPCHNAHYIEREIGRVTDQKQKLLFADRNELGVAGGNCRGAARRAIDQGHFSEDAVLRQRLEHAIAQTNFDLTALNNEQFMRRVTLPEDDVASLEVARGNASTCQKSKINRRIRHIGTPGSECVSGGALSLYEDYLLPLGSR